MRLLIAVLLLVAAASARPGELLSSVGKLLTPLWKRPPSDEANADAQSTAFNHKLNLGPLSFSTSLSHAHASSTAGGSNAGASASASASANNANAGASAIANANSQGRPYSANTPVDGDYGSYSDQEGPHGPGHFSESNANAEASSSGQGDSSASAQAQSNASGLKSDSNAAASASSSGQGSAQADANAQSYTHAGEHPSDSIANDAPTHSSHNIKPNIDYREGYYGTSDINTDFVFPK